MVIDFNSIKSLYLANSEVEELYINGSKVWEKSSGLTFTAEEANSTVAMQKVGSAPDVSLEYSTGDGWHDFIVGETTITLSSIGDQMVIRAKTTNSGFASSNSNYNKFVMTGKIAASDSIMYLLKNDGDLSAISS